MDGERIEVPEGETAVEETGAQEALSPGVAELANLLRERDDEVARLGEQVKRMSAEFENFRRRQEAERLRLLERMKYDLVGSMLPLVDHLDRALAAARSGGGLEALVQGMELVQRDAMRIFEGHGVQVIEAVGQAFDPNLHEAVLVEERGDVPDETVVDELQRGYRIGERLLRASMVKVARHPA